MFTIEAGRLAAVEPGAVADGAERLAGPVVPGLPNLHSHAFQRAMAGLAETASGADSFWSWRDLMYRFVARLTPDDVQAIAAQLQVELLEGGVTTVGEFHYLANQPGGAPYDDPAEMAERIVAAAVETGIGLCLLPVVYERAGFAGGALEGGQRRFAQSVDGARRVAERIARHHGVGVGLAPHSLRAVRPESLRLDGIDPAWPVHIHVAEQRREVEECLATHGVRPVEWLLGHADVGRRWCLVHATHATAAECAAIVAARAVVGLCPTTEANLGDGVFPARAFLAAGGRFGVGSDSHVCTDVAEELRLLEYGQRLTLERRAALAGAGSVGRALFDGALAGGAVVGHPRGLAPGERADLVVLDAAAPSMIARADDAWLDAWFFAAARPAVRDVFAGGRPVVREGRHAGAASVLARFGAVMRRLLA